MFRNSFLIVPIALLGLTLAGCDVSTVSNSTLDNRTSSQAENSSNVISSNIPTEAGARLESLNGSNVTGSAHLKLNTTDDTITVTVNLTGLKPGHKYTAHINSGSARSVQVTFFDLSSGVADNKGVAAFTTVLRGVKGMPGNWFIHVTPSGAPNSADAAIAGGPVM